MGHELAVTSSADSGRRTTLNRCATRKSTYSCTSCAHNSWTQPEAWKPAQLVPRKCSGCHGWPSPSKRSQMRWASALRAKGNSNADILRCFARAAACFWTCGMRVSCECGGHSLIPANSEIH
eukprot:2032485-Prymnesium_polylepis.1